MKSLTTQVLIGLFLLFCTWESFNLYRAEKQKTNRLSEALEVSQKQCEYFTAKDKTTAVKIQVQELTISELRQTLPAAIQAAKNLYIIPRLIQGYTQATTQGYKEIKAVVKDSIIRDTIRVSVINYQDKFYSVRGVILRDTATLKISSLDSLDIFTTLGPRRHPWAWILSHRGPDQVIIRNANPDNKIILRRSIKIKR